MVRKNEKNGTWEVRCYYKNIYGELKQKTKRGFKKKSDAIDWERDFKNQKGNRLDMTFGAFVEIYFKYEEARLKYNTMLTKKYVVEKKILPYFQHRQMEDISTADVIEWQNHILAEKDENGKAFSQTYLKTIHAQLSAIFNHAVNMYGLPNNPARKAGTMGSEDMEEIEYWTKEEYQMFIDEIADKDVSYYAFEMLYWCGIRLGELLALTRSDFDFVNNKVRINKSYQKLKRKEYITTPKTKKSNRVISMPAFLATEMQEYIDQLYGYDDDTRIFQLSKSYMHHEMDRGAKAAGVKRISIHGLRHSHISLLLQMGFSAVAVGNRVGHESVHITFKYAHLFPSVKDEMANKLDMEREEVIDVREKFRSERALEKCDDSIQSITRGKPGDK